MKILPANPTHAADIARLIITAMTDECCQFLVGPNHTLDDFHNTMLRLVLMDDSQYSWRNAFVAVDDEAAPDDIEHAPVAGAIVGYDGKDLHRLRRRFQEEALSCLGMDYSNMDDETQEGEFYLDSLAIYPEYRRRGFQEAAMADWQMDYSNMDDETAEGEFYLDSLAVYPHYRKRGIASQLLNHFIEHAASLGLPAALLVDKGNPSAERLYTSLGFEYCNDATWGGHAMRHLLHKLK